MKIPHVKEILVFGLALNAFLLMAGIALEQWDTIVLAACSGVMCGLGLKLEKMRSDE